MDMWTSRELPVLRALVDYLDDPDHRSIEPAQIADLAGLPQDDVHRALRALAEASPPYIEGVPVAELTYPIAVTGVTERARRAVGQWPNEEALAETLVRELRAAAAREPDEVHKGKLHRAADALSDIGVKVVGEVLAKLAAGAV